MDQRFHTIRRRFQLDKAVMSVRMKKWAGIIQEAAVSGLTKSEFCKRNGIDRRQFFHWQKQLHEFALQHNPELAMIEVPDGPRQLVRAVNAQLTTSLPVFCELKPPDELPAVPERKAEMVSSFPLCRGGTPPSSRHWRLRRKNTVQFQADSAFRWSGTSGQFFRNPQPKKPSLAVIVRKSPSIKNKDIYPSTS